MAEAITSDTMRRMTMGKVFKDNVRSSDQLMVAFVRAYPFKEWFAQS
jgi:hypothetical protein